MKSQGRRWKGRNIHLCNSYKDGWVRGGGGALND